MNKENKYGDFDLFAEGATGELMGELRAAAFEYLLLHPGSEFGDWQQGLVSEYPAEVVDALGVDPQEVFPTLADLWESDYLDPATGIEQKYCEWAMAFANEYAIGIYSRMAEVCNDLRRMDR